MSNITAKQVIVGAIAGALCFQAYAYWHDSGTYTLYRTTYKPTAREVESRRELDKSYSEDEWGLWRIHVATFDTSEGAAYNRDNCERTKKLFQSQDGVRERFWCEPGQYRGPTVPN